MNQAAIYKAQNNAMFSTVGNTAQAFSVNASPLTSGHRNTKYTHFISTEDSLSESFELIKVLRAHQQSGRWTVLIAPQNIPDKALLTCCSVDMDRVLVVHAKNNASVLATVENALSQSTCSAVVAWTDQFSSAQLQNLNALAEHSSSHFYAFNRTTDWKAQ